MSTIEWEGTAERVAFHAPYILLFDSRFIEIRHVETGLLLQIIPGSDVRCIWDGRGISTSAGSPLHENSKEAQVHVVMNAPVFGILKSKSIVQRVCELTLAPTVSPQSTTSPIVDTTSDNNRLNTDFTSEPLGSAYATSYYAPSAPVPYAPHFNTYPSSSTNSNLYSTYGSLNTLSYVSSQSQPRVSLGHSNRIRNSSGSGEGGSRGYFSRAPPA